MKTRINSLARNLSAWFAKTKLDRNRASATIYSGSDSARRAVLGACGSLILILSLSAGCQSPKPSSLQALKFQPEPLIQLREGDLVQIAFPSAPDMNTTQKIRRDGKISLRLLGDVQAAGKTPLELQHDLAKLSEKELQSKEVLVTTQAPSVIYVAGAVLRPGRVSVEHPITALQAIMEAGGFNQDTANLKKVEVIRQEDGAHSGYFLNLEPALRGKSVPLFYLHEFDIIYVPQRIQIF